MFPNRFGNHSDVGGIRLFQPVEHLRSFFGGWRIRLAQLLCQLIQTFPSRLLTLQLPFLIIQTTSLSLVHLPMIFCQQAQKIRFRYI